MLTYTRLARDPSLFRTFTGLEVSEFDSLHKKVESRYDEFEEERLSRPDRKKEVGEGGRHFKLELNDRLLMLMVYYRLYITLALTQFLFDLDLSNVWRDIRYLEPVVKECIPLPKKMHEQVRRLGTVEEVEQFFPGFKAFVDTTEQEIPRPKDSRKRKTHYSGKRKKHTVKTQLTVNGKGLIVHKPPHARGRRHDLDVYRERHPSLPKKSR
ncbi:MAG: transposase [Nitrososphaerota archaeon]|nr:transposase [Nitrososphaerota archaeon]